MREPFILHRGKTESSRPLCAMTVKNNNDNNNNKINKKVD